MRFWLLLSCCFSIFFTSGNSFSPAKPITAVTGRPNLSIGFLLQRTVSINQKACSCPDPSSCSCCQSVTILLRGVARNLCVNFTYAKTGLSMTILLGSKTIRYVSVIDYRAFKVCTSIPDCQYSFACVDVVEVSLFPKSITICMQLEITSKNVNWLINYNCISVSTLLSNQTNSTATPTMQPMGMPGNGQMQPGQMQPGQMQPGQMQPGQMQPGQMQPGQMQPGQMQPGQMQPGQMQPGQMQPGQMQPGQMQPGQMQPGQMQPGQMQPGQMQPGQMQPGQMQPGQMQPGQMQPGQMQPGQMQPGQMQPGQMQPGQMQPGQMQPGQMQPGQMQLGQMQPGQMQPGQMQPGQMQPGQMQPGQMQPGQMQPGQMQPGQMQPGQVQPGQMQPGQMQPGQMRPGQVQPGQMQPGQMQPGQMQPGQMQPGQMPPGQMQPGQMQPGQMQPGQMQPGQMQPGQMPPGQMPPGQMPPGQIPPGQMPPGQMPPGQMPSGQIPPRQIVPGQMQLKLSRRVQKPNLRNPRRVPELLECVLTRKSRGMRSEVRKVQNSSATQGLIPGGNSRSINILSITEISKNTQEEAQVFENRKVPTHHFPTAIKIKFLNNVDYKKTFVSKNYLPIKLLNHRAKRSIKKQSNNSPMKMQVILRSRKTRIPKIMKGTDSMQSFKTSANYPASRNSKIVNQDTISIPMSQLGLGNVLMSDAAPSNDALKPNTYTLDRIPIDNDSQVELVPPQPRPALPSNAYPVPPPVLVLEIAPSIEQPILSDFEINYDNRTSSFPDRMPPSFGMASRIGPNYKNKSLQPFERDVEELETVGPETALHPNGKIVAISSTTDLSDGRMIFPE